MSEVFTIYINPILIGIIISTFSLKTFDDLTLPQIALIYLLGILPIVGYLYPFLYLILLWIGDGCNIRTDTKIGKFIDKWYDLGN